ncbi:MAG: succinate dehydrogenase/fumarate reductase flavoprotein subunit [Candidatus Latescibacterota bacterium]|jgi:succinate dehydrogenase/fumarate reductase flavoprotein subunit
MDKHHDIIIAGAGIGGLCAALRAQEKGASVAVIEKAEQIGGSAAASGGTIWCATSLDEWLKVQPGGDPSLGSALVEYFYEGIRWLSMQGVSLEKLDEQNPYKFKREIYKFLPDARGALEQLAEQFQSQGGTILTNTSLTGLIGGKGNPIRGIKTNQSEMTTQAVILATGGFQANAKLRAQYFGPQSDHMIVRGVPDNTGGGFQSALDIGAQPTGPFDRFYGHLLPAPPAQIGLHNFVKVKPDFSEYAVLINLKGERFDDEFLGDEVTCHSVTQQPEATAILIFDEHIRANQATLSQWPTPDIDRVKNIREAGGEVIEAASIQELAQTLTDRWGIPATTFQNTMAEYSLACAHGKGQNLSVPKSGGLIPLSTPPYYAIRTLPGITFTYGGVKINDWAEVLDTANQPIPGLYASGADCGGVYTKGYTGGLCMGLAFGLIAGQEAAHYTQTKA